MNLATTDQIAAQLNTALNQPPLANEIREVESCRFCMDDIRSEHALAPIITLAKELIKLKGKRIESIDWVSTYEVGAMAHTGFFRVKVS